MLTHLKISNYILIDELELDFHAGLTVVTGETGSGKSIIIDALMIVFGSRVNKDIIRNPNKIAYFEAEFNLSNDFAKNWLIENELIDIDNQNNILVRRIIDSNGKNKIYINGHSVTINQVKTLGDYVLDIHTQNASITLLKSNIQRKLLDEFAGNYDLVSQIESLYAQINKLKSNLDEAKKHANELEIKRQILTSAIEELSKLNLGPNEWTELEQQHNTLANRDKIIETYNQIIGILDDPEIGILRSLHRIKTELLYITNKTNGIDELINYVNNAEIELSELNYTINHAINNIDIVPLTLQNIESRMNQIFDISRKYRITPEEIPSKLVTLKQELDKLNQSLDIDVLTKELDDLISQYMVQANKLSKTRNDVANSLSIQVSNLLHELAITGHFIVKLIPQTELTSYGMEQVEYQISFNKGMNLQPLAKVASGGELSRTALALYLLLSIHNPPEVIIFDEIDVGIGGKVASSVGKMLYKLGLTKQVICITHQAQTAVFGDHHILVNKKANSNTTNTILEYLNKNTQLDELSRMISGVEITTATLNHVKDMLNQALRDKCIN